MFSFHLVCVILSTNCSALFTFSALILPFVVHCIYRAVEALMGSVLSHFEPSAIYLVC